MTETRDVAVLVGSHGFCRLLMLANHSTSGGKSASF